MTISCKSSLISEQLAYDDPLVNVAYDALDAPKVVFIPNIKGDYILCTYKDIERIPNTKPLRVVILEKETTKISFDDNINLGNVKWSGDYMVEITNAPGMPDGDQADMKDYTYFIDARTGKEIKENSMSE